MATKSENADIGELQTQMVNVTNAFNEFKEGDFKDLKQDIKDIKDAVTNQDDKFATKEELEQAKRDMKRNKNTERFLLIILTVFVTFLATYFLQNISHRSANDPTTSHTTTTTTPTGSTSTTSTKDNPSSANASASSKSDSATPSDSQTSTSNGSVDVQLPKVLP